MKGTRKKNDAVVVSITEAFIKLHIHELKKLAKAQIIIQLNTT